MGEDTKIEWTDHTFNPWVGCTKVSAACDHCYAEGWAKRTGAPQLWQGQRRRTSEANWQKPLSWNLKAERAGTRARVFCASLADVFDNQVPTRWRDGLWWLIEQTPNLDWLLLTKRPQNIAKMLPDPRTGVREWGDGWPNVWLGTTAENQEEADRRIPVLLETPAAVRFLSAEPLLGPVDLTRLTAPGSADPARRFTRWDALRGTSTIEHPVFGGGGAAPGNLDLVIVGGESGPGARPMHPDWARALRDSCRAAGVAFFFKQWGAWAPGESPRVGAKDAHFWPAADDGRYPTEVSYLLGKARAGRLLDGRTHDEMPGGAR